MIFLRTGTEAAGVLTIILFNIAWQYDLFVFRGASMGCHFVDTMLGLIIWYLWFTGILLLLMYTSYALVIASSMSNWLNHIRYDIEIERIETCLAAAQDRKELTLGSI
jgi:hypothetical protein